MSNTNAAPKSGYTKRTGMVPAFGNVGFPLKVGEVGMAEHDARNSPYGWHIIKRVE
jgi:parvulin-like peptidyl-prolyl isomerase